MSSAINAYAVPLDRLKQVVGSGDQATIDAIVAGHKAFLSSIDDIDDEATITCADAVADLVNGEIVENVPGYLYGYGLEAICAHIGEELPNICPIARATAWIKGVDALLESKGVSVRLTTLVFGGSPVPIPEPDDYPGIGEWSASEVPAALAALRSLDLTGVDEEMAETFAQIRGWLEEAAKRPGVSIIGFLS
jgi:hypothetical protein